MSRPPYEPKLIHYDDPAAADPHWEIINADVAAVTGQMRAANVEFLYDMTDREKVIGLRVYEAAPAPEWQGMETAPKDRKIVVWLADEGFPVMATWRVLEAGTEDEWQGFWLWEMDYGQDFHDVTHWQPLPAAPTKGAGE